MIFDNCKEIEKDLKSKITSFLEGKRNLNNDVSDDIKSLVSLSSTYLYEMKRLNEIDSYKVNKINSTIFHIDFYKESVFYKLEISLDFEYRKMKINKIKSHNICK